MKDPKDNKTISLIPDPKLRGRPSTGSAMTAAQRKAEQRKRDRQLVTNENLTDATTTALCEQLQHRVSIGDVDLVKGITLELMKRARLAMKNNVTVTKIKTDPVVKPKSVTVTKTKPSSGSKPKSVTVTKNKPKPTAEAIAPLRKREAELKKMIAQTKPKQSPLL